jgi:hypothetical protein
MAWGHFMHRSATLLIATMLISIYGKTSHCQTDDLAKTLNLTSASKSLPLWSKPTPEAVTDLTHVVHSANPSIFIVGKPDIGFGTAFLISKQHRLLATNAHVADIMHNGSGDLLAIQNGTSNVFKIEKAYYHPGVRRSVAGVTLRTSDPSKGEVDPRCPDVAVLQLADGADLPDELTLATQAEIYDLFAQPVGMLGFPGHDTVSWPGLGQKAEATFREGVVSRATDFLNNADAPPEQLQFIQHSMANWFGFSGSPIFLPNGHVVALNNSGKTESKNGLSTNLAYGVRIDCLWELLKANKLLEQVNVRSEAAAVDIERYSQPDPSEELLKKVDILLDDAWKDYYKGDFASAAEKCNQSAHLLPNYARIYKTRVVIYQNYSARNFKLDNPLGQYYDQLALEAAKRVLQLEPDGTDTYLDLGAIVSDLADRKAGDGQHHYAAVVVQLTDKLIEKPGLPAGTKAYAYNVRAGAKGFSPETLADLKRADALDPYNDNIYWSFGLYYENNNDDAEAKRFATMSRKLREAEGKREDAWDLATSPDDAKRNGNKAFQLASEICQLTDYNSHDYLHVLAAAYAECGDFNNAIEYEQRAIKLAPEELRDKYAKRLKSYQDHKPARQEL